MAGRRNALEAACLHELHLGIRPRSTCMFLYSQSPRCTCWSVASSGDAVTRLQFQNRQKRTFPKYSVEWLSTYSQNLPEVAPNGLTSSAPRQKSGPFSGLYPLGDPHFGQMQQRSFEIAFNRFRQHGRHDTASCFVGNWRARRKSALSQPLSLPRPPFCFRLIGDTFVVMT